MFAWFLEVKINGETTKSPFVSYVLFANSTPRDEYSAVCFAVTAAPSLKLINEKNDSVLEISEVVRTIRFGVSLNLSEPGALKLLDPKALSYKWLFANAVTIDSSALKPTERSSGVFA